MTKRLSIASALLVALSALLAMILVATPAVAHHNGDHDKGKGHQSKTSDGNDSGTTEANDGDARDATDPNADEGDNKHPSGKDRSVENGGSGNQGNSASDPDDDGRGPDRSNGGPDKPGGSGGVDADDQDGNNGCGNDDDFEDDNEGWCGKKPDTPQTTTPPAVSGGDLGKPTTTCPTAMSDSAETCGKPTTCPTAMSDSTGTCGSSDRPDAVLGDELLGDELKTCPDEAMAAGSTKAGCTEVLGVFVRNDKEGQPDVLGGSFDAPATRPATAAAPLPFTGASIVLILVIALGLLGIGAALFRTRRSN